MNHRQSHLANRGALSLPLSFTLMFLPSPLIPSLSLSQTWFPHVPTFSAAQEGSHQPPPSRQWIPMSRYMRTAGKRVAGVSPVQLKDHSSLGGPPQRGRRLQWQVWRTGLPGCLAELPARLQWERWKAAG